jgi:putative ABC transport system permease protein
MSVGLQFVRYQDPLKQVAFFDNALQRIRSLPGVIAAGACTSMPPTYIQQSSGFTIEGRPVETGSVPPSAIYMPATAGYLEALGIPLVRGRTISETDTAQAPGVLVINQTLASRYFPQEDPLGRRMTINGVLRTVVGVVGDAKFQGLGVETGPQAFVPYAQSPFPGMRIVVRTTPEPSSLVSAVRAQIQSVDSEEGPTRMVTMNTLLSDSVAQPRFNTFLIGLFAAVAFILSAIGIYGVISYEVAQRTSEIGIRMALGAQTRNVLSLILKRGLLLILSGLMVGLLGAFALTRFLSGLLFDVTPTDPLTYGVVAILLTMVALAACFVPARRATKVDPLIALRYE